MGNQSFSLGRTCGVWGVNHETIKKRCKDPIVRALLQVFWDTMREMANGFSYSTCHVNNNFLMERLMWIRTGSGSPGLYRWATSRAAS